MATTSRARVTDWTRLGRAFRGYDPQRFAQVLELVVQYVDVYEGRRTDAAQPAPKPSRSEKRAQKRRAAFRVIEGGLGKQGTP